MTIESRHSLALGGCYTFYTDPRAVSVGGYPLVGAIDPDGSVQVGWFRSDGLLTSTLHSRLQADDHANPALLIRKSDSRILAFYSRHVGPRSRCGADATYLRVSTNPKDPTAWGPEIDLGPQLGAVDFGYANPVQLAGERNDPIYNFFRCTTDSRGTCMHFSKSEDGGESWGAAIKLAMSSLPAVNSRPYFRVAQNGDRRIDFCINDGHPGEQSTNSVYHFYYEGANWFGSEGTHLGDPPFVPADKFTMVFDGSTINGRTWVWSIEIDAQRNPVIAYAAFSSTCDHRYRYARWNGSAWDDNEIVAAGGWLYPDEPYYSGGVCIDPDDVNAAYYSRQTSGVFQLFRAVTADGGKSWVTAQLTHGGENCFRPYVVRGLRKLVYVSGTYTSYTNYKTRIELMDIP